MAPFESIGEVELLSPEAGERIEALETLRVAGLITDLERAGRVRALIGDAAPNVAFAGLEFFGDPLGGVFDGTRGTALQLSATQREFARAIYVDLHEEIGALRKEARSRILELIAPDKAAVMSALGVYDFGFLRPLVADAGFVPAWPRGTGASLFEQVVHALGLSPELTEEFRMIREELMGLVEARHELARDEFESILDEVQLDVLDNLEA